MTPDRPLAVFAYDFDGTLAPGNMQPVEYLAMVHLSAGDTSGAREVIRQAIAIEPRDPDYHYNLGSVLNATGRMTEAIGPLTKAGSSRSACSRP